MGTTCKINCLIRHYFNKIKLLSIPFYFYIFYSSFGLAKSSLKTVKSPENPIFSLIQFNKIHRIHQFNKKIWEANYHFIKPRITIITMNLSDVLSFYFICMWWSVKIYYRIKYDFVFLNFFLVSSGPTKTFKDKKINTKNICESGRIFCHQLPVFLYLGIKKLI